MLFSCLFLHTLIWTYSSTNLVPLPIANITIIEPTTTFKGILLPPPPVFPVLNQENHAKNRINQLNITNQNVSFILEKQLRYCPYISLCNISSTFKFRGYSCCKKCECSTECYQQGTCCPDMLLSESKSEAREACVRPQLKSFAFFGRNVYESYFMTFKCLSHKENETNRELCEKKQGFPDSVKSFLWHVPVTSTVTKVTYINKYCALCNDEAEHNLIVWKSKVSCPSGVSIFPDSVHDLFTFLRHEARCNIFFFTPGIKIPTCNWGEFTQCNQTGEMDYYDPRLEYGCQSFTSLYSSSYRNVLCYMCNRKTKPKASQCVEEKTFDAFDIASFTALLDYRMMENEKDTREKSKLQNNITCMDGQRYDQFKNVCKDIFCSTGLVYSNGTCNSIYAEESMRSYEVYFRIESNENCISDLQCVSNQIRSFIEQKLIFLGMKDILCRLTVAVALDNATSSHMYTKIKFILVHLEIGYKFPHNMTDVIRNITTLENFTVNVHRRACNLTDSLKLNISIDDKIYGNFFGFKENNRLYVDQDCGQKLSIMLSSAGSLSQYSCLYAIRLERIIRNHLRPRVSLSKKDYNFVYKKTKICLETVDVCFEDSCYKNETNQIVVMSESYFSQIAAMFNVNETAVSCIVNAFDDKTTVSLVFTTASITCLLVVLIVYSLFKELRTTPGKNNIALTINLLFAQMLFEFGSGQISLDFGCKIIGISMHFFWLSTLFWMNSCTIHMFRVFAQYKRKSVEIMENSNKDVVKYSLYTYGLSTCFVLANVIIRSVLTGGKDVGYGGCLCFISTGTMVGFTFALPVALIIVANFILFLFVVFSIHNMPKVQSSSNKNRKTFLIYTKLSCLTGISWIFGFIYQWTLFEPLAYIFIVLNAGQGVYIMLAFVCNRRVINMLKTNCNICVGKYSKTRISASSGSNRIYSTTTTTRTSSRSKDIDGVVTLENKINQSNENCRHHTKL